MLIKFSVGNFRSFKEIVSLDLESKKIDKLDENTFNIKNKNLIKSSVIYGANASGKSNLINAFSFMKNFMVHSSKDTQIIEEIPIEVFRLNKSTINKPAFFEIVFFVDEIEYRYGFELDNNKIHSEWLFYKPNSRETKLFTRSNQDFDLSNIFKEGKILTDKTRTNALFLSVNAQFNGKYSQKIISALKKINIINGFERAGFSGFTIRQLEENKMKSKILNLLKFADLGIKDINIEKNELDIKKLSSIFPEGILKKLPTKNLFDIKIKTSHNVFDENYKMISDINFDFETNESEGTKKFFDLAGPVLDTLENGKTLIVDELEANLHPLLLQIIIKLFNSSLINKKKAQLIFITHDINILSNKFFNREQIWFIEKNKYGESKLYSLLDIKDTRKDSLFFKDYLLGKYGAIPNIGNTSQILYWLEEKWQER